MVLIHQLFLLLLFKSLDLEFLHVRNGNQGVERTTDLVSTRYYWPGFGPLKRNMCKIVKFEPEFHKPKTRMGQLYWIPMH